MRFSFVLLICLVVVACKKHTDYSSIKIIAHAAAGLENPNSIYHDNSKEAIELALSTEGCAGVEVDVQLSKDEHLWLFHDELLDEETNLSGCIHQFTNASLQSGKYATLKGEKLLELNGFPIDFALQKTLFLDLRHYSACESSFVSVSSVKNQLASFLSQKSDETTLIVILSTPEWIDMMQELPCSIYYSGGEYSDIEKQLKNPAWDGFVVKNQFINHQQVVEMQALGKKVVIFEVRSPKGIRKALNKFPDYLMTDDLRATLIAYE